MFPHDEKIIISTIFFLPIFSVEFVRLKSKFMPNSVHQKNAFWHFPSPPQGKNSLILNFLLPTLSVTKIYTNLCYPWYIL